MLKIWRPPSYAYGYWPFAFIPAQKLVFISAELNQNHSRPHERGATGALHRGTYESRAVVLNLFYIAYPLLNKITRLTPNTLSGAHWLKSKLTNFNSLEWFVKIYICCNLWFSTFTPLEDEIYPGGKFTPG